MRVNILLGSTAYIVLMLGIGSAGAQETGAAPPSTTATNTVEQIVVTARKRAESIQNVPLSVQAVTGEALTAAGVTNAVDLEKVVPALQIHPNFFGADVQIRIRGFGSPADGGLDADVASYIDGAYIARPGATLSSFLDVKSVEVLSGPQGTLFGRNAAMGALSITTNTPSTHAQSFDVSAEAGSYGTYAATGVANLPVSDQFAVRIALKQAHTDGDFKNDLDGKTYGEKDTFVGRGSTKWTILPNLSWTLRFDGSIMRGDGVFPLQVETNVASASQLAALSGFARLLGGVPPEYHTTPSYHFNNAVGPAYNHNSEYGVISNLDWAVNQNLTLNLIDTYRDWENTQIAPDGVGLSVSLINPVETFSSRSTSHELQLISSKDAYLNSKLGFTAGIYYFHEDYTPTIGFDLGPNFCSKLLSLFAPPFAVAGCEAAPQQNAGITALHQTTDSYAVYGQANYKILPTVDLDLGARETWDRKSGVLTAVTANPIGVSQIMVATSPTNLSFSDAKPSLRASLSWHMTSQIMPFLTYSTGYKSGGFDSGGAKPALTAQQRTYGSETVDDVELGVKSIFLDGKALLDATGFLTLLHNFQDEAFNGVNFYIRNAGEVRAQGVDVSGQYRPIPALTLNASGTYLNAYYVSDKGAPGLEGCSATPSVFVPPPTPSTPVCSLTQDLSGRPIQFAPTWQGTGGFEWKIASFGGGYTATFAGSEFFTSSFFSANNDNPQSKLPGYFTTDLRLSLASPDTRWKLDVFGSNVFDKHYYVATSPQLLGSNIPGAANPYTGATIYRALLGDPARFGVRVTGKF